MVKRHVAVDTQTGQVNGSIDIMFAQKEEVDTERFTKLYVNNLKFLFDLRPSDIRVLTYIMSILKPGRDTIILSIKDCMEYAGIGAHSTIRFAIGNLLKSKILAKTPFPNTYFINPKFIFNGDRMILVRDITRKKETQRQIPSETYRKIGQVTRDRPSIPTEDTINQIKQEAENDREK